MRKMPSGWYTTWPNVAFKKILLILKPNFENGSNALIMHRYENSIQINLNIQKTFMKVKLEYK